MSAQLYVMNWFKHSSAKDEAKYTARFSYRVEGLGEVSIETEIPKAFGERLDAIGKEALWEKIGKTRK